MQVIIAVFILLAIVVSGCGSKQVSPAPGGEDDPERPRQAEVIIKDPAGPIPAPALPPEMAAPAGASSVNAVSGQSAQKKTLPYTVKCTVRDRKGKEFTGKEGESPEEAGAKSQDASVLIATFEKTSILYRLADTPPESLTGLEQRLSVALGEAKEILNSYGYYAGRVRGKVQRPKQGDGERPSDGPVEVRITFIPGQQYSIGKSTVQARVPEEPPKGTKPLPRSLDDVGLAVGSPAVAADVLAAVDRVQRSFLDNGYPFAKVSGTRYVVDHETHKLDAEVHVAAGAFVRMGDIERHGASSVKQNYVDNMRIWRKGRPWNQSRVEAYQDSLRQSGLFQSIEVKPGEQEDEDGNRTVVTTLESAPERTVGGALKYHSDFGPGVQGFWEHRNLTGNGDRLRIEAPLWLDMQEVSLNYRLPFFMRRDQDFIANGGFLHQDTDAYQLTSAAAAAGIERRFNRRWSGSIKGSAEGGNIKEPDKKRRDYFMLGLPLGLVYDSTNSLLNATKGQRLMISTTPYTGEYEGDFTVLRTRVDGQAFLPLVGEDTFIMALRGSLGLVYGADSYEIPPSARFYSGGGGSVRGYEYQSLGPRNSDRDPLGGNALVEFSAEGRWKFTPEWGIVAFLDGGTAFDNAPGQSSNPLDEDLRWGAGLGLRYYTAIGPVRFDIATPLNPRKDDDSLQFYISIGQSF